MTLRRGWRRSVRRWIAVFLAAMGAGQAAAQIGDGAVIYPAETVLTMTGEGETAEAVAAKGGEIVGVGALAALRAQFPEAAVDETFKDKVVVPGLIDPHLHVVLGAMFYAQPFAAPWPMAKPGGVMAGYPTRETFLKRVRMIVEDAKPDGSPVVIYGYHNLVQSEIDRKVLDDVVADRPLIVWHFSGHDFYLNSKAIELVGATPDWAKEFHGVDLDAEGALTGRIYEDAALAVFSGLKEVLLNPQALGRGAAQYFEILRQAGVTTTADLGYGLFGYPVEDELISKFWSQKRNGLRLYLVPEFRALKSHFKDKAVETVKAMLEGSRPTPAPVLPRIKFFTDGAFYSQTMRVSAPGYLTGQSKGTQGLWVTKPEDIEGFLRPYLEAGYGIHIHSNGDAAQTATLDALAAVRKAGHKADFVIEHGGLFSPEQRVRAGEQGAMVSAASHYVFFMAGAYAKALGQKRALWISPLGGLTEAGVPVALHSDAPLAPPQPLRAAGAHVTRATREGDVYAKTQALSPYQAMEAITLDAARVLGLGDKLGSIEAGKRADFTVLEANPLETPADQWADIEVWGVVLDGVKRPLGN